MMDINTINCRKNSQMIKSFFAPLVDCESNLVAIEFYFYFFFPKYLSLLPRRLKLNGQYLNQPD
jgi:hypothetical protein